MRPLLYFITAAIAATSAPLFAQTMLVAPYVQPGDGATLAGADVKSLIWFTDQTPGEFTVEYGIAGTPPRKAIATRTALNFPLPKKKPAPTPAPAANPGADAPTTLEDLKKEVAASSSVPFAEKEQHYFRYVADLAGLPFDSTVSYRVKMGGDLVREGAFKTRASAGKTIRFVAVGDLATGKPQQNGVAWQIAQQKPDFMIALGDIVYSAGRAGQYMHHFFPTYNDVPKPGPQTGAPIMASVPIYPVIGNHDIEVARISAFPDAWGAFYFFRVPHSGPGPGAWSPVPSKDGKITADFQNLAGAEFPAMLNYSWDDGPAHFMALDCGAHVKGDEAGLLAWIEHDLQASKQPWKIVCFHAPAFHTSREHYTQQKMRTLEPLFERCGVDLVLNGHVHNYQRSKPLRFQPAGPRDKRGRQDGELTLDETFDGVKDTTPEGIIHVVSGGGGASLYSQDFPKTVAYLQKEHGANYTPLTANYYAAKHSFSVVDITPTIFKLRQIAISGEEVDAMTITKPAR